MKKSKNAPEQPLKSILRELIPEEISEKKPPLVITCVFVISLLILIVLIY